MKHFFLDRLKIFFEKSINPIYWLEDTKRVKAICLEKLFLHKISSVYNFYMKKYLLHNNDIKW